MIRWIVVVLALALSPPALGAMSAQEFVTAAARANLFEIRASEIAMQNALESEQEMQLRDYAEKMVEDHSAAQERLRAIAAELGLAVPQSVEGEREDKLEFLVIPGMAVDPLYAQWQLTAHEKALALFQAYAEEGDVPALVAYAREMLPVLRKHHQIIAALIQAGEPYSIEIDEAGELVQTDPGGLDRGE